MAFRFVHAADLHLDSPLRSLALRDPELAELIGNATRRAFAGVVRICLEERIDALLLSGDLYDGEQTSMKTARFLADQVDMLHQAGIRVFIIRGNHDALSRITRELSLPGSVTIFGSRAEALTLRHDAGAPVVIHGISFAQPHAPDSLLPKFGPPVEGAVNIGLLHTSLGGAPGHDPYAPCSLVELGRMGFRYWALGHVHRRSATAGDTTVIMPGMPQGRDIGEAGAKTVTLATVGADSSITLEERLTSVAQFERVVVDLEGAETPRDVAAALAAALGRARDAAASEHLVARLHVTGATPLAWGLLRDADLLQAEAQRQVDAVGRTSIDKIEVRCRPPAAVSSDAAAGSPVEELGRLMATAATDDAFYTEAATLMQELRTQLPTECRAMLGTDAATSGIVLDAAIRGGIDEVLARLQPAPRTTAG